MIGKKIVGVFDSGELHEPSQNPFDTQEANAHRQQDAVEPPLEVAVGRARFILAS